MSTQEPSLNAVLPVEYALPEVLADMQANLLRLREDGSQLDRRNYVRSVFAFVEGIAGYYREYVMQHEIDDAVRSGSLNVHRLLPLLDEDIQLTDQGKTRSAPSRFPLKNVMAYLIRCMCERIGEDPSQYFSQHGWNDFRKAYAIRNRVTHPQYATDVVVSDEDVALLVSAVDWLDRAHQEIRDRARAFDRAVIERLRRQNGDSE